jgi:hypothetical protein
METSPLHPTSSEEIFGRSGDRVREGTRFSLARLVIILYITGLFAAMLAASMPPDQEQPPSPTGLVNSPNPG